MRVAMWHHLAFCAKLTISTTACYSMPCGLDQLLHATACAGSTTECHSMCWEVAAAAAPPPCWCCGGWELAGQWRVASSCLLRKIASSSLFKVIGRKGVTVSRTTSQSFWLRLSSRVARACSHRAPLSFQPLLIVCCN